MEVDKPTAEKLNQMHIRPLSNIQLLGLTALIWIGLVVYSLFSDGFYQHDEAAHYVNMLRFWFDPSVILNNWAKPGFKMVMLPFSLMGSFMLTLVNSLLAAASGFIACKVMEKLGYENFWLPLFVLAIQPFWVQLGFRNYSEILTAFLLISAVWGHYSGKVWLSALILSFILTIRQEFYPLVALYGLFLIFSKQYKTALILSLFPLLHNAAGWWAYGDPFYLINAVFKFSNDIQSSYPRQGFWHYPKMLLTVFGGVAITSTLVYVAQAALYKLKVHWVLINTALLYVGIHMIFNIQSVNIGPATGGNLRYLLVISPIIALLSAIAIQRHSKLAGWSEKNKLLIILVPFCVVTFFFLTYRHNNLQFIYARNFVPFIIVFLLAEWFLITVTPRLFFRGIILIGILSTGLTVRPLRLSEEDQIVKNTAEWLEYEIPENRTLLMNHTLLYYYLKISPERDRVHRINAKTIKNAPPGSVIVWDTHYTNRPFRNSEAISLDEFQSQPDTYKHLLPADSTRNGVFSIHVFEKLSY
jgi:hypothetical protein